MDLASREGLFLFKTGAITLELCGNNLVERDKIMIQGRGDNSCGKAGRPETL